MTAMMKFTAMIKVVELLHRDFAISDGSMHCCFHRKRSLMYLSSSYIKPGYSVVDAAGRLNVKHQKTIEILKWHKKCCYRRLICLIF